MIHANMGFRSICSGCARWVSLLGAVGLTYNLDYMSIVISFNTSYILPLVVPPPFSLPSQALALAAAFVNKSQTVCVLGLWCLDCVGSWRSCRAL